MNKIESISEIKNKTRRMILIDKSTDEIILFKPKKIERNGRFPYIKEGKLWREERRVFADGLKKWFPNDKFKSDNISWICHLDAYKINLDK